MVDPDTREEISDRKKPRIALNNTLKVKTLKHLFNSSMRIHALTKMPTESTRNLNVNMQVANVVFTCHNILRQRAAGYQGNMEKKSSDKDFTLTFISQQYSIRKEDAIDTVNESAKICGIEYKKYLPNDADNWYGIAGPYLCFFVGFGLRYTELRLGHSNMPMERGDDGIKAFPLYKYGLYRSHHILLEGCTFPPEMRSSMAQSLGPMTTLLCYIRSEGQYEEKWKRACKRAMSHIPLTDYILSTLKGKKSTECSSIITNLADMILLTTSRQAQRAFFPIILAAETCIRVGDTGRTFDDNIITHFNVSGKGAFMCYKRMSTMEGITIQGEFTQQEASQVMYHSIFGTFKEDLGILSQITSCATWYTREEIGKKFQGVGKSKKLVKVIPITQEYYRKLSSANQTGLLSSSYLQVSSIPVFSGSRSVTFTSEFFESIGNRLGSTMWGRTIEQLQVATKTMLNEIVEAVQEKGCKLEMGTVKWRSVRSLTDVNEGEETDVAVVASNKFFLGRNQ